jgi:hypothetical protein
MIKNTFLGKLVKVINDEVISDAIVDNISVRCDSVGIEIDTFDVSGTAAPGKLDILYYNSINRFGEILRSVVFISDMKLSEDTSPIYHRPDKYLNNSTLEKNLVIDNFDNKTWLNSEIEQSNVNLLENSSRGTEQLFDRFDLESDSASEISDNRHSYDGWYTLVSLSLPIIDDLEQIADIGKLVWWQGNVLYAIEENPRDISDWKFLPEDIVSSIPIFNILGKGSDEVEFVSKDIFVIQKTHTLYKELLESFLDREGFNTFNKIRPKIRSLYSSATSDDDFSLAQTILNSIALSLDNVKH